MDFKVVSALIFMQRSQQDKELLLLEVGLQAKIPQQLHATTTPDGQNLMTFNHHDINIALSLMVIRFMLLAEMENSKLNIRCVKILILFFLDTLKYGALTDNQTISN